MLFRIRQDLPSRNLMEYKFPNNIKCLFVELYISHKNGSPQNAHRTNIDNHLYKLRKVLDISDELHQYGNFVGS